jgi:hypothetical protein
MMTMMLRRKGERKEGGRETVRTETDRVWCCEESVGKKK